MSSPEPTMLSQYNAAAWLLDRNLAQGGGSRTAFRVEGASVSYDELARDVFRVQQALADLGVGMGERVVLILDDELAFPAWFLGCLRSGVIPVPLSTMLTARELGSIVEDASACLAVVSERYAGHLPELAKTSSALRAAVLSAGEAIAAGVPTYAWSSFGDCAEAQVAPTTPDSSAFWLYSSGTTGVPKGVMHRHASLQATADTYARSVLAIAPSDRCLSVAKLFFAFGLGNSLTFPLSVGATSILNPRRPTPAEVLELVRSEEPTLFFSSPGFIAALLDSDPPADAFASVRCTVTAGEALPAELYRRFHDRFGHPVLDGLGTTEALHIFLSNVPGAEHPGTTGVPVPGYEVRLVGEDGADVVETDTPGYLHVRGPSLATGYWRREEASRGAFRDGWLATGDVYRCASDGSWIFLGRNNDMIKASGIWVSPAEVESVLVEHPAVLEAAVVGARDANGLETTVAFLVPRSGEDIEEAAVERHCRERMAAFKRPRRIVVVDRLPKTATGKVQRYALRERLAGGKATSH